jgi:hypothetical protein
MLAMLPSGLAAFLAAFGVTTTSGPFAPVAEFLSPVAKPLLVVATLTLVAGVLHCGRLPAAVAAAGGTLLYLSMYVLPSPPSGEPHMRGMADMAPTAPTTATTNAVVFYLGLALFVSAYVLPLIYRRRGLCRPVLSRRRRHSQTAASSG